MSTSSRGSAADHSTLDLHHYSACRQWNLAHDLWGKRKALSCHLPEGRLLDAQDIVPARDLRLPADKPDRRDQLALGNYYLIPGQCPPNREEKTRETRYAS